MKVYRFYSLYQALNIKNSGSEIYLTIPGMLVRLFIAANDQLKVD